MNVIYGYVEQILTPQLTLLGLSQAQVKLVGDDVFNRLHSALFHWPDLSFRRTLLLVGTEEAECWEPSSVSLEVRSLVVVAVRNSLLEDVGASRAFTKALRSKRARLPDHKMPSITIAAAKYFHSYRLDETIIEAPRLDVFGAMPQRFPAAWYAMSLLGNSSEAEIPCELPSVQGSVLSTEGIDGNVELHTEIESGIDPNLNEFLRMIMKSIEMGETGLFLAPSFKGVTRHPEKLFLVIDHVLRHGGTVLTPNYLLSPNFLARRIPLLRPAHLMSEFQSRIENSVGLCVRHKELLKEVQQSSD